MPKYYVFPYDRLGNTIYLAIKAKENPRTGKLNYLAELPNAIGGNSDGREALATCKTEAEEETHGKLTITSIELGRPLLRTTYKSEPMVFYVSLGFKYNPDAVLAEDRRKAIDDANKNWSNALYGKSYKDYLNTYKVGLTYLENTGYVGMLPLETVDISSDAAAALSIVKNTKSDYRLAEASQEYATSHTVQAIRLLAAWQKYTSELALTLFSLKLAHAQMQIRWLPRTAQGNNQEKAAKALRVQSLRRMKDKVLQFNVCEVLPPPNLTADHLVAEIKHLAVFKEVLDRYLRDGTILNSSVNLSALKISTTISLFGVVTWMQDNEALIRP